MKKRIKSILILLLSIGFVTNIPQFIDVSGDGVVSLDIANGSIEISSEGYRQANSIDNTVLVIANNNGYEIIGRSTTGANIKVISGNHNITINGLEMSKSNENFGPFSIQNDSTVNLKLVNSNVLTAGPLDGVLGRGSAGIEVSNGNSIVISGNGNLEVTGGAASAAIGGSPQQKSGDITILGGNIKAYGGSSTGGSDSMYGGAAIGGGGYENYGNIYIGGKANLEAVSILGAAAIGSSGSLREFSEPSGTIIITDEAKVIATSAKIKNSSAPGAAIGGGYKVKGGKIEITRNAKVKAIASESGAAIGGGENATFNSETSVLIKDNADVQAIGAGLVSAIGNGKGSTTQGTLEIEGNPIVFASTYGTARTVMEDKAITAVMTNKSSSAVLKGYYNMIDGLAENKQDSYLNIITGDNKSYVLEYGGVTADGTTSNYYSDYILITPANSFEFKNDKNENVPANKAGAKSTFTINYKKETDTVKTAYAVPNSPTVQPIIEIDIGIEVIGWYTESTFDNQWDFTSDMVTKDITLYAKWREVPKRTVAIDEEKQKILKVYKGGVNEINDTNSKRLSVNMTNKGADITADYDSLEWEVENIAGFEGKDAVCKIDETTGTIIGLKSGVAKVTVKLKTGYDPTNTETYDTVIIIVPGNVNKTGVLALLDSIVVMRKVVGIDTLENMASSQNKEYLKELSDMDGDGKLTMFDVACINRMLGLLDAPSN